MLNWALQGMLAGKDHMIDGGWRFVFGSSDSHAIKRERSGGGVPTATAFAYGPMQPLGSAAVDERQASPSQ